MLLASVLLLWLLRWQYLSHGRSQVVGDDKVGSRLTRMVVTTRVLLARVSAMFTSREVVFIARVLLEYQIPI